MQVFDSYIEAGQDLKLREREQYYRALVEYIHYGREPEGIGSNARAVFTAIKPSLKISKARAEAGRAGGSAPSKTASKSEANREAKHEVSDKRNGVSGESKTAISGEGNSKSNSNKKVPTNVGTKETRFACPSVDEVRAYIEEGGYTSVDPDRFVDHYASNGWKVGKNPMKDWKAAVRNWHRGNVGSTKEVSVGAVVVEYASGF